MALTFHSESNVLVMGKSGAGKQPRIDVLVETFGLKQLSTGDLFRSYLKKFDAIDYEGDIRKFYDADTDTFVPDDQILSQLGPVAEWDDPSGVILGLKAKFFVESGLFAPDSLTNAMFEAEFVHHHCRGMVLDGYPRTLSQAELLLDLVIYHGSNIDGILFVDSNDDQIVSRLVGRRICPCCKKVYHVKYKPPVDGRYCPACGSEVIQRVDDYEDKIRSRLSEYQQKTLPAIRFLRSKGIPYTTVPGYLPVFSEEAIRHSVMESLSQVQASACF
jgi:adenylate kinase